MKKTAKVISVVLAILMVLSVFPIVVFAENKNTNDGNPDETASERVDGWKTNYKLLLDTLLEDSKFTSWNYVDQNQKALKDTMNAYTAFALYDEAWKNYITHDVSVEEAEKILLAIIEKAEYTFDDGYVDEIVNILSKAENVNDFIQKVNDIVKSDKFSSVVKSDAWGKTFEIIGDVEKIANIYQEKRDEFIEAYARVLSVQLANAYYIDLLDYIKNNATYTILKTAAANLINSMNKSINDVANEIVNQTAGDGITLGVDYLLKMAINSNVYTATANTVYEGVKSIADLLWNSGDQYALIDSLVTAYHFQSLAANWTENALNNNNNEKSYIAVDLLITSRTVCENILYNLKKAENDGVVGKVKSKLYGTVYEDIEINNAALNLIREIMFNTPIDEFKQIKDVIYVYCPVNIDFMNKENSVLYTLEDGKEYTNKNDYGIFSSVYSEYSKDYLKLGFLYDNLRIRLNGQKNGTVTLILDKLTANNVEDWSFTDVAVNKKTKIVFDTDFNSVPDYTIGDGTEVKTYKFNDIFVPSEHPEVSAKDVIDATVDVGKDETKSFLDIIKDFFQKIADFFKNLFKF